MKNYYAILGVEPTASPEEIKKAYRQSAMKHHPDRNQGDASAEQNFKEAQEAYETLSDPEKRKNYDNPGQRTQGTAAYQASTGFHFDFNTFFDFFGGTDVNEKNFHKNLDIEIEVSLTLEESVSGVLKQVVIDRCEICKECQGLGSSQFKDCGECGGKGRLGVRHGPMMIPTRCNACGGFGKIGMVNCAGCSGMKYKVMPPDTEQIKFPAGISPEHGIKLNGKGHINPAGKSGDLIIKLQVQKHDFFHREGLNLYVQIPLTYSRMVLGCNVKVPLINGKLTDLSIPPGTFPNQPFRLWGQGVPQLNNPNSRGELIAIVKLDIPKQPNQEYLDLLNQLEAIEEKNSCDFRKKYEEMIDQRTSAH